MKPLRTPYSGTLSVAQSCEKNDWKGSDAEYERVDLTQYCALWTCFKKCLQELRSGEGQPSVPSLLAVSCAKLETGI